MYAFYFHLYGLCHEDASYVLDTSPSSAGKTRPNSATKKGERGH